MGLQLRQISTNRATDELLSPSDTSQMIYDVSLNVQYVLFSSFVVTDTISVSAQTSERRAGREDNPSSL